MFAATIASPARRRRLSCCTRSAAGTSSSTFPHRSATEVPQNGRSNTGKFTAVTRHTSSVTDASGDFRRHLPRAHGDAGTTAWRKLKGHHHEAVSAQLQRGDGQGGDFRRCKDHGGSLTRFRQYARNARTLWRCRPKACAAHEQHAPAHGATTPRPRRPHAARRDQLRRHRKLADGGRRSYGATRKTDCSGLT